MPLPSSLTGVTFTATSGNPPVSIGTQTIPVTGLSLGPNSFQITDSGILDTIESEATINPSVNFSYGNGLSLVSTTGTPYPPPPIILDTNGVTIKYTRGSIPSSPYFIQANPRGTGMEWFAVVNNNAKDMITDYATNLSAGSGRSYFTNNGNTVPFNNIVTTLMTSMLRVFENSFLFNEPIASWDTFGVTDMYQMFSNCYNFNQPIGYWNTFNVADMGYMFNDARVFNQDLRRWNVLKIPSPGAPQFNNAAYALNPNYLPIWGTAGISL